MLQRLIEPSQYTSNDKIDFCHDRQMRPSAGAVATCFVNALAESVIGLYKAECVRHEGPWRGVDDLDLATLNWVWWFNELRLHGEIGPFRRLSSKPSTTVTSTPRSSRCWENRSSTEPGALHSANWQIRP